MKSDRLIRMGIAVLAGTGLAALVAWMTIRHDERMAAGLMPTVAAAPAAIGGPFSLEDHHGKAVTEQDYAGHLQLIVFGYTYCPDICPTELQTVAQALDQLEPAERAQVRPLFITIDPQRDNRQVVADYVALFHPDIIGLTGTPDQVARVAKAYRVYYAKSGGEPDGSGYMMDHSTSVYLMAPDGTLAALYKRETGPEQMVADIRARLPVRATTGG